MTKPIKNAESFGPVVYPDEAAEPILSPAVRAALLNWLEEIWAEDELKEVGIEPRRKALFYGPPGTGKTTLAHHLCARLGLPMLIVQSDRIISKYVGQSERNIGELFRAVEAGGPYCLFIDELDTLAGKRIDASSSAGHAHNAQVNVMLQYMERYNGLLIGATNRTDALDTAIWRRFQLQVEIDVPGQAEREHIIERYLAPYLVDPDSVVALARDMNGATPALIREFCEGLKRQIVLGPRLRLPMDWTDVLGRLTASIAPHPELVQPVLWKDAARSRAAKTFNWPLTLSGAKEETR